jgi:hypothetical protein
MTAIVTNSRTGGRWEFDDVFEAEAWIGEREAADPDGVYFGDYTIDDMELTDEEAEYISDEYEDDGQPDELTEWMDFDPDC